MFIAKEERDLRVSKEERIEQKKQKGCICHLCQKPYSKLNNDEVDFSKMIAHHKHPIADGGRSIEDNMLYLCNNCDEGLHLFLDSFRVMDIKIDYEYLTTVYIWLFAKSPSQEIKKQYLLGSYKYKGKPIEDYNINKFANKFMSYCRDIILNENINTILFRLYIKDLARYNELPVYFSKKFIHSFSYSNKNDMFNFRKLLESENHAVRLISNRYKKFLNEKSEKNLYDF